LLGIVQPGHIKFVPAKLPPAPRLAPQFALRNMMLFGRLVIMPVMVPLQAIVPWVLEVSGLMVAHSQPVGRVKADPI